VDGLTRGISRRLGGDQEASSQPGEDPAPRGGSFLQRMRERLRERTAQFRERWVDRKLQAIVGLLDKLRNRVDQQMDRSGNETTREMWTNVRGMIESLKNVINGMSISGAAGRQLPDLSKETENFTKLRERLQDLQKQAENKVREP